MGVKITQKSKEEMEILEIMTMGNATVGAMMGMARSKLTSRAANVRIYSSVIQLAIMYDSELSVLNNEIAEKLR